MEAKDLEFLETMTVEQFKAAAHCDTIHIKRSKNDPTKYFFVAGNITGPVSTKATEGALPSKPMVSRVKGEPTEKNPTGVFLMIHQYVEGLPDVATF